MAWGGVEFKLNKTFYFLLALLHGKTSLPIFVIANISQSKRAKQRTLHERHKSFHKMHERKNRFSLFIGKNATFGSGLCHTYLARTAVEHLSDRIYRNAFCAKKAVGRARSLVFRSLLGYLALVRGTHNILGGETK